jgi:hypothetical protein
MKTSLHVLIVEDSVDDAECLCPAGGGSAGLDSARREWSAEHSRGHAAARGPRQPDWRARALPFKFVEFADLAEYPVRSRRRVVQRFEKLPANVGHVLSTTCGALC